VRSKNIFTGKDGKTESIDSIYPASSGGIKGCNEDGDGNDADVENQRNRDIRRPASCLTTTVYR
jgi:hypothetical protein